MSNLNTNLKVGFPSIWAPTDQKALLCATSNRFQEYGPQMNDIMNEKKLIDAISEMCLTNA